MSRKISVIGATLGGTYYSDTSITTISLAGNTNNLNVGLEGFSLVEISSTGNYNLTGIVVPDNTKAWELKLFNKGTNNIIIKNNDAGSSAEDRFLNGMDITCQSQEGLILIYRPSQLRWSCPGKNI